MHTKFSKLTEPSGSFYTRGVHPEARKGLKGSLEILPRFARQDVGSNIEKNTPTPQLTTIFTDMTRSAKPLTSSQELLWWGGWVFVSDKDFGKLVFYRESEEKIKW